MQTDRISKKKVFITLLRVAIGWHFLYEGISKLIVADWSAYSFLINTSGFLSGFYHWLASSPGLIKAVDILNIYGLILIGLALFLGLFTRIAAISGTLLLTLYYFAYPPFGSSIFGTEGSVFIVDRIFLETAALLLILFSKDTGYGIDAIRTLVRIRESPGSSEENTSVKPDKTQNTRREALKNLATLPLLGFLGLGTFNVQKKYGIDVMSGATIQVNPASIGELRGELPKGRIGIHEISRLLMGGNLIGGWAHARDLIYASSLFKAYNTEKKVYETLMLAENAGMNSINIGHSSGPLMAKYKKLTGSNIKVITQVAPNMDNGDIYEQINSAMDAGADILQIQGNWCDWLVRDKKFDVIVKMMDRIRSQGYTAGLGAHSVDALVACEENGIIPDYYMKTMHHDNYWSAHPRENRIAFEVDGERHLDHNRFHDNIFCLFPEKSVEFVNKTTVPVMGFKVLAAGSIRPEDGFRWAFENGADFICVGMFDFQVVDNVNITINTLNNLSGRKRRWFA
ncbi:MAG: DoxX family protein [Bacteroidales bacterium]